LRENNYTLMDQMAAMQGADGTSMGFDVMTGPFTGLHCLPSTAVARFRPGGVLSEDRTAEIVCKIIEARELAPAMLQIAANDGELVIHPNWLGRIHIELIPDK